MQIVTTTNHGRRWLDHYRTVPSTFEPASRTGLEMFRATVLRARDAVLVHYFDRALTAGAIDGMSDALAVAFQRRGVRHGDRVAMHLQNVPQALLTVLAAWKCGAVVVPCNPMLRPRELEKILGDSAATVLVAQDDLYRESGEAAADAAGVPHVITTSALDFLEPGTAAPPALAGMRRERQRETPDLIDLLARHEHHWPEPVVVTGDDTAFLIYTSGTTGEPKAAANTHRNVVFATSVYERWLGLSHRDTILGLAPLSHVTGLIAHATLSMLTGSPLVLFYRFDAEEACRLIEQHRATFTVSAVTAFIALLASDAMRRYDLSTLTKVYTGGAPTPPSVLAEWHARTGSRLHPMYGLTEATSPTHMTPYDCVPPIDPATGVMSIGVPVCNTEVRVVTEGGHEAAPGQIGELRIAGPQIIPGYWNRPAETAASLPGSELRTGDIGFMDEEGWFYLVGRAKDMIVASGFKVWPREVEDVLYQHPAVREAAVVGVPDWYRGETVKAVVSLKPGQTATPEELEAFARRQLAAYKAPRLIEIVDELPKTASGKILRRLLVPATGNRRQATNREPASSRFARHCARSA
jgi:long-chain acyl-CoA synthetase